MARLKGIKSRFKMNKSLAVGGRSKLPEAAERAVIALDIGPREIRAIKGGVEASIPTPEGTFLDGVIVNPKAVAEKIKSLFKSKGIGYKNVVTAASGKGVLLRLIELPSMGPEAMREAIKDKASKYMVFAGSEVVADFYPVEGRSGAGGGKIKVLSVVAKKEIIDSYIETLKLAELNLEAIDAGCLSLARAIYSYEAFAQGVVCLRIIEHDGATIFIFKDGRMHYLHHVDAREELDAATESIIGYAKKEFGEAAEIKQITSTDLEGISIAGGLALRESEKARFPIKINLLPLEEIRLKEFNRQALQFVKALGVLVLILVLYFCFLRFGTYTAFRDAASIQSALNKPTPLLDELLDIAGIDRIYKLEMKDQEAIIERAKGEPWAEIIGELKKIIPKKAYLSGMESSKEGKLLLEGEAMDQNAVFDFVRSLKTSRFFDDVKLEGSKVMEGGGEVRTSFIINCRLTGQGK